MKSMSNLKIKQIDNLGGEPGSYIAFDGFTNKWQKIRHIEEFTDLDLTGGVLTVEHNLGRKYVVVTIFDEDDSQIIPDQIQVFDDMVEISLNSFDVTNWVVMVS